MVSCTSSPRVVFPKPCLLPQGLFRNFGDTFLPVLRPHMERLVADTHESKQRCVAEIISGLIRGCKHWSYIKVPPCFLLGTSCLFCEIWGAQLK